MCFSEITGLFTPINYVVPSIQALTLHGLADTEEADPQVGHCGTDMPRKETANHRDAEVNGGQDKGGRKDNSHDCEKGIHCCDVLLFLHIYKPIGRNLNKNPTYFYIFFIVFI